jgi:elongation factor Ts
LKNSGKNTKIVEKIAFGKLNKFIGDNTLLNQEWIMEPKKKVKDVIKEFAGKDKFEIKEFSRFKVGEGL